VLTNQIYNEYQSRLKEARYLIETYKTYKPLQDDIETVELFLSLSIFHRRVITNFDGVLKFYATVSKTGQTETIRIGSYNLTGIEKNKILAVVLSYNKLLEKFSIQPAVMEYYETRAFLKKLIILKSVSKNDDFKENKKSKKGKRNFEDGFPF
jgi:hypothetical protein